MFERYGSEQIRNTASLGGNIGSASPIGDSLPVLMSLNSKIITIGKIKKIIYFDDFFIDYRKTKLAKNELVKEIIIPIYKKNTLKCYKISKRIDDDISSIFMSINARVENNTIKFIKIVSGGMASTPKIAKLTQDYLINKEFTFDKIEKAKKQSQVIEKSIVELEKVKKYMLRLDKIQSNVFSRDGSVAISLRSWALNSISVKASEYLSILNTKIQRIALSEKAKNVSIACHSKTEVLELESLSGGEKVSVALALRLGMASLLGASNLNLMILDEPTTHLDTERKKSLVDVLSQLSRIEKSQLPMQFLIITHDAEIFENSNVEQIYKFESREEGSRVTAL